MTGLKHRLTVAAPHIALGVPPLLPELCQLQVMCWTSEIHGHKPVAALLSGEIVSSWVEPGDHGSDEDFQHHGEQCWALLRLRKVGVPRTPACLSPGGWLCLYCTSTPRAGCSVTASPSWVLSLTFIFKDLKESSWWLSW